MRSEPLILWGETKREIEGNNERSIYWPLQEAVNELIIRQANTELVREVNEFLGEDCPLPEGKLCGVLGRQVAGARWEDVQFEERCRKIGLEPIFLEFPDDMFVTNNPAKTRLVFLQFWDGEGGETGGLRVGRINIVDPQIVQQKSGKATMRQIETRWGENLVEFHHRARRIAGLTGEIIDMSGWFKRIGSAREYYKYYLAACGIRAILFESFHSPGFGKMLDIFNQTVVLPSIQWVQSNFGYSPLIVYHPEVKSPEEEERFLNCYPPAVLEAIP